MTNPALGRIRAITCDIFGTTVDWRTGVADRVAAVAATAGVELDAGRFADDWRARYLPSLREVNDGGRDWAYLDTLHRESLDALLGEHGIAAAFDEAARRHLVLAWHRLPAWDDAVPGLARLRTRFTVAALSNGGFALLTSLVKAAALPFDCILSAELARRYKPAPEPYLTAARLLDVAPDEVLMVAAHGWDLAGARAAGLRTAFLERPAEKGPHHKADTMADIVADSPADVSVTSFEELADALGT